MNALPETYSFLNSKLVLNGYTITDFATDITLGPVNGDGRWIETEATAEGQPFAEETFVALTGLARRGIQELLGRWW